MSALSVEGSRNGVVTDRGCVGIHGDCPGICRVGILIKNDEKRFQMDALTMNTRARLLEEAELLMRKRGYCAFSYADLAEKVHIRKASIHHHFATKEALGLALVLEYLQRFKESLADIEAGEGDTVRKLRIYSAFFADSLKEQVLPLCGALAAETDAMPDSMRCQTREFFELHLDWLERIIRKGKGDGMLRPDLDPGATALLLLSVLEGASLVAWVFSDPSRVVSAFEGALAALRTDKVSLPS